MRNSYPISELCSALSVSRSTYYAAISRPISARAKENEHLLQNIKTIHTHRHTRCYGSPRMIPALAEKGLHASKHRVARLMRSQGLRARPRKPFRPKTTAADHQARPSPNLLAQVPAPTAPGEQIVSDITYIPTDEGWLYLAVVIDLFSRCILGWKISESMQASLVGDALKYALQKPYVGHGTIFHSDRGSQYSAALTRQLLERHGLRQSMSAKGYCYDNAFAESTFASLKAELFIDQQPFETRAQASTAIFDYLETFFNRSRLHSSLEYQSPNEFLKNYFANENSKLN